MNLLFCVDENYTNKMLVTLYSLLENTEERNIHLYVVSKEVLSNEDRIRKFCQDYEISFHPIRVGEIFKDAPVSKRYPSTIYYRLLAHYYLPKDLDKVLYLDADILVINDIKPLYDTDVTGYLYGASSHSVIFETMDDINRARVSSYENEEYYNSGVLVMNLENIRKEVKAEDIYRHIDECINPLKLILPDQDILNTLYGHRVKSLPDVIYNYDTRLNLVYYKEDPANWNPDWVMENTVVLHYCGKDKPWDTLGRGKYDYLYKHYEGKLKKKMKENY